MACHLFAAEPLSEPMLAYYEQETGEQIQIGIEIQ